MSVFKNAREIIFIIFKKKKPSIAYATLLYCLSEEIKKKTLIIINFLNLKKELGGKRFVNNEEVQSAVDAYFNNLERVETRNY